MEKIPDKFKETVLYLAETFKNHQYAFRGTTSLVLQNLNMNVDDIDILCNKETALLTNKLLKDFIIESVSLKESKQFKSYFGKFKVNNIPVEIIGEWQIKDQKGNWSDPFDASSRKLLKIGNQDVYVTTVEDELMVFAKMGRWTAYHKIPKQTKEKSLISSL